jgi:hypothetical protein
MKKQTSIEWYSDMLSEILGEVVNNFTTEQTMANHYALKQAEEMRKQEIMDAYWDGGQDIPLTEKRCEQYYTETYRK